MNLDEMEALRPTLVGIYQKVMSHLEEKHKDLTEVQRLFAYRSMRDEYLTALKDGAITREEFDLAESVNRALY